VLALAAQEHERLGRLGRVAAQVLGQGLDHDGGQGDGAAAGGAVSLALHAHGGGAILEVPGLVDHQHHPRIAEVLDQVGADAVLVPHRPAQQVLLPCGLACQACSASLQPACHLWAGDVFTRD
jgi:hypothetical protein